MTDRRAEAGANGDLETIPARRRVGIYTRGARILDMLAAVPRGLHGAFCLGWFDREDLAAATAQAYARWSRYADREYNASGLSSWEVEVLERHFAGCRSLLVTGAGGGRECVALARRGLDVVGFDCSPSLVRHAKALLNELGLGAAIVLAEPDGVPSGLPVFDGVVVGWGAYMHIPGRGSRIEFLRRLREHVKDGGPILLSFFTRPERSRPLLWTWRIARAVRRLRGSRLAVELGDSLRDTFDHHFTEGEVRGELAEAGFEMLRFAASPYGHAVGVARPAASPAAGS